MTFRKLTISLVFFVLCVISRQQAQTKFQHVVLIIQENRTVDNLFGSNPNFEPGVDIEQGPLPLALGYDCDITHSHTAWLAAYDNGGMDGWDKEGTNCPTTQAYVDNSGGTLQPYFDLAMQYGWANRMFQTNQGPSYPAHQFLISGSSAPSEFSSWFVSENTAMPGCPLGSPVRMIGPLGQKSSTPSCFQRPALPDLLATASNGNGFTWRYYGVDPFWIATNSIKHLYRSANDVYNPPQVLSDISNCNLQNVVWVTPADAYSDHPGYGSGGPAWVASIVNAIGQSHCGYWQNTAILITWDDWGGWYDHVPPPQMGQWNWNNSAEYIYGFRVPLIVVSAYTPAGYVDNDVHDFGSLLRFTESNFGLGLIGPGYYADSYADDLSAFFLRNRRPRPFHRINARQLTRVELQSRGEPDSD